MEIASAQVNEGLINTLLRIWSGFGVYPGGFSQRKELDAVLPCEAYCRHD